MKRVSFWHRPALGAMLAAAMLVPAAVEAGQVTVHIQGVRSDHGIVHVA